MPKEPYNDSRTTQEGGMRTTLKSGITNKTKHYDIRADI